MTETRRVPYAVVRYHHDRVRDEAVNVGVVVQTEQGLRVKTLGEWEDVRRAYPFLDISDLQRHIDSLTALLDREHFSFFDYAANTPIDLKATHPEVLSRLNGAMTERLQLTEPRFAELSDVRSAGAESPEETLLTHLFEVFAEPPRPQHASGEPGYSPMVRRAHMTLRRAAVRTMVRSAREAGLRKDDLELDATRKGTTREWRFDVGIPRASRLLHHILVLPDIEETYHEAAALGRIWQDVLARHRGDTGLTAVFYGTNGIARSKLEPGERLLRRDRVKTVYARELPHYYRELLGQQKLWK